jgi:hypothetical protein
MILGALGTASADAQTLVAGGAVGVGIERFGGDPELNRLDGTALGWTLFSGVGLGPLVVRVEGWRDGAIDDIETTSLVANGRPVTIQSSLAHHAHAVEVLAGHARDVSSNLQIALVGGISYITISRSFTTNAGELLLVRPSTVPATATTTRMTDRFAAWSVGGDISFRAADRVRVLAGVRTGPLRLKDDLAGFRVRLLAGAVWTLR